MLAALAIVVAIRIILACERCEFLSFIVQATPKYYHCLIILPVSTYADLFDDVLSSLYHSMNSLPNLNPSDLQTFLPILDHIGKSSQLSRLDIDIEAGMQDIKERVRQVTTDRYEAIIHEKESAPRVNRVLPL